MEPTSLRHPPLAAQSADDEQGPTHTADRPVKGQAPCSTGDPLSARAASTYCAPGAVLSAGDTLSHPDRYPDKRSLPPGGLPGF